MKPNKKLKISQIDTKNSKIDLTKNPKPWNLVRTEFAPTSTQNAYSVNKLVDANLNEILPSFNYSNIDNSSTMKPIFVGETKTLYFPYRWGRIAVLNVESGDLKWDIFDFEIAQMSLFGGKYYLNEYRETCDTDKYSQILTCNLFEIDRNNLKDRKIALESVKNNQIVMFANEKDVWLKTIYKERYSSYYGQNSSESDFTQNDFSNNELEKLEKYKPIDKLEQQKAKPYTQINFEQNQDLIGANLNTNVPMISNKEEGVVKNCPKKDRQNPCWSEIEKLVNKYYQSVEFKDESLEKFWSELKENKPKNLEAKCGDFIISGENGKNIKYKNNSISGFEPFGNLKNVDLNCFG